MREVELLVIGAGAAGTAAALTARELGIETVLIDENPIDPAFLQRNIPKWYGDREAVRSLSSQTVFRWLSSHPKLEEALAAGVEVLTQHSVWGTFPGRVAGVFDGNQTWLLKARQLILATGSTDLHLAFPGWTLSGVLGAGGALNLLETYGYLTGRRMLILGSGDLGLTVAERAIEAGIEVAGIVEIEPNVQGDRGAAAVLEGGGIPFFLGYTVREAQGGAEVERVLLTRVDGEQTRAEHDVSIEADTLCVAIGQQPAIELPYLSGCAMRFDRARGGYYPRHEVNQRTSQEGILVAGDVAGAFEGSIRHPATAEQSGRLAAFAAAESLGRIDAETAQRLSAESRAAVPVEIQPTREKTQKHGSFLSPWQRLADAMANDGLIICRCEEVTRGAVLAAVSMVGAEIPDEVKRVSRAGMGLCQGRGCRPLIAGLLARRSESDIGAMPIGSYRPPVRPLPLAALATEEERSILGLEPFDGLEARLRREIEAQELPPMALRNFHWRAERIAYQLAEKGASPEEVERAAADVERQLRYSAARA